MFSLGLLLAICFMILRKTFLKNTLRRASETFYKKSMINIYGRNTAGISFTTGELLRHLLYYFYHMLYFFHVFSFMSFQLSTSWQRGFLRGSIFLGGFFRGAFFFQGLISEHCLIEHLQMIASEWIFALSFKSLQFLLLMVGFCIFCVDHFLSINLFNFI